MEKVFLKNTGLLATKICFGSLTVGPLQANLAVERAAEIISYAFSKGINFIDTAQLYKTYPHICKALRLYNGEDVIISSKTYAYTKEMAQNAVEEARRELNRDVIDIFMLHEQESIHTLNGHREAFDYLCECKAKGIIRLVGASMHTVSAVKGATLFDEMDVIHPLINVNGLGIADGTRQEMENALIKAKEKGIFIFSMKPLGGGNLFKNASECLAYAFSLPFVDSVAIGMQSEEEIDANIDFLKNRCFSKNQNEALMHKSRSLHIEYWCSGCGQCVQKCPQKALHIQDNRAICEKEQCVLCGYCSASCENFAIKIV